MPTIKFKLKDKNSCEECPCLSNWSIEHVDFEGKFGCSYFGIEVGTYNEKIRPQRCITENGE